MRRMRLDRNTRILLLAGFLGIAGTGTSIAFGQDKLGAQALFDEAKHLMDGGKTSEACPKFEASLQLDTNNVTTLMALAQCYEKLGRLASAYLTYRSAESEATDAEQTKRAKTAHDKAEKLFPKLSRLTIRVTPEANVKGLQVSRNGMNVAPSIWGTPIPVDPGQHEVVAHVGGKKWSQRVDVGGNAAQVFIDIPAFAPTPTPTPVVAPVPKAAAKPAAVAPRPTVAPVVAKPVAPVATVAPKPAVAVAPRPVAPVASVAPKPAAPVATAPKSLAATPPPAVAPAPKPAAPVAVAPAPKPAAPPPAPKAVAAKPVAPAPVAPAAAPPAPKPAAPSAPAAPKAVAAANTSPPAPAAPKAAAAPPMPPPGSKDESGGGGLSPTVIGIGVASLGVVGVGVGTYFMLRSNSKEKTANENCGLGGDPNLCNQTGIEANDAALSAKKAATWSYIAGGALITGGVVLIVVDVLTESKQATGRLQLHPFVGSNAGSLTLTGTF